jgi:phosphoribosylamine--glycine ligase
VKLLVIDIKGYQGNGLDLVYRAQAQGHQVIYHPVSQTKAGDGLVKKSNTWENWMKWADLIVPTGNAKYPPGFENYFNKGFPIFGTNPAAAELELDRAKGQEILDRYDVETIPYVVVGSLDEAAAHLIKTKKPCVIKPWGGESDKALTHVCKSVEDGLFTLKRWKEQGLGKDGKLMLQDKVDGVEIGVSGFFGPGGWNSAIELSFEHKKFLTGDLGQNTGEMGTVIQHVEKDPLFEQILNPLTDHLHLLNYIGDCAVNLIVDKSGTPLPLEFTMRLGWPDFAIRQHVIKGDCLQWMVDLVYGKDSLRVSKDAVVGVCIMHGDFPEEDLKEEWAGFPIYGLTETVLPEFHFGRVMAGSYPTASGDKKGILTAGNDPLIVTGNGRRVRTAKKHAYGAISSIDIPSNLLYRTDIGDRLEEDLPKLHKHGYAKDMEF